MFAHRDHRLRLYCNTHWTPAGRSITTRSTGGIPRAKGGSLHSRDEQVDLDYEKPTIKHFRSIARKGETWNEDRIQFLLDSWRSGHRRDHLIADYLRMPVSTVTEKLKELGEASVDKRPPPPCTMSPLLPEQIQNEILKERGLGILKALDNAYMTPYIREVFEQKPLHIWLEQITQLITSEMKSILTSLDAPTIDVLKTLPHTSTPECGVYAWILTPRWTLSPTIERHKFLYIGMAVDPIKGGQTADHLNKDYVSHMLRTWYLTKYLDRRCFVKLLSTTIDDANPQTHLDLGNFLAIAKAVLTTWLGAFDPKKGNSLAEYCPWNVLDLQYDGVCSHNPLAEYEPEQEWIDAANESCFNEETRFLQSHGD